MSDENEKNLSRWQILQSLVQVTNIGRAFALLREHNIEPILLKGWTVARYYPNPPQRLSTDIDLAVSKSDFAKAKLILQSEAAENLPIDLHREFKHLDSLDWQTLVSRSELHKIGASEIRVLCPEDNFRVLCVHWLNDGGVHRRRLWDIFWMVKNRPPNFDWEKCLGGVSAKRRKWIISAIGLAHLLYGLPINDLPFAEDLKHHRFKLRRIIETVLAEWIDKTMLMDLHLLFNDRKRLQRQISKRLSPNLLQAIIETDAEIDDSRVVLIKSRNFAVRLIRLAGKGISAWRLKNPKSKIQNPKSE